MEKSNRRGITLKGKGVNLGGELGKENTTKGVRKRNRKRSPLGRRIHPGQREGRPSKFEKIRGREGIDLRGILTGSESFPGKKVGDSLR